MSSVVGAERKGKRLAPLEDIISKLSIIASQSCCQIFTRVKIDLFNNKNFEKMFMIRRISFYFDLHRLKKGK